VPAVAPLASHPLAVAATGVGVRDARVLEALATVPRARYVPPEHAALAGRDRPIRIAGGQVTTQPSLVAVMVEALALRGDENVLEVGSGLGYEAAVLARLARAVWTVERRPDLAEAAIANLDAAGVANVHVVVGDGSEGLPAHSPYDAIVVAAAHPRVPPPLAQQLAPGGRLVQPIGSGGAEDVTLFRAEGGGLVRERVLIPASFVLLRGRHGFDG
jgi:protein-L-isoaspartate(D-aspartate) O-methyltransferase